MLDMNNRWSIAGSCLPLLFALLLTGCGSLQPPEARSSTRHSTTQQPPALSSTPGRTNTATHRAVQIALAQQGVRYRYGGNSPSTGFDCSGLIQYSYNKAGIRVPRTTKALFSESRRVSKENLKEGDILFFRLTGGKKVSHAGIYVGNGKFVHAPSSGKKVSTAQLGTTYWAKSYIGAGRF